MVVFGLSVKCNLEGIQALYVDQSEYEWCLKVKCCGCGEESPNWHSFSSEDTVPLKGGRGQANFIYKCKLCSRENSIDIVKDSLTKITAAGEKFVLFVKFDCRGLEPINFQPKGSWIAESDLSSSVFKDIDLSESDWAEYDSNAQETVGIYDFTSKFDRVK